MEVTNDGYQNPIGFSREIAGLLTGLGCSNLTEFRKRDISLDDLKCLTKEDLNLLGVDHNFDFESYEKLSKGLQKKHQSIQKASISDVIEIFKTNQKQLQVLNIYIKCIYLELLQNQTDFFIDKNKNLKASKALIEASHNVLQKITCLEKDIDSFNDGQLDKLKFSSVMKSTVVIGGIAFIILCTYGIKFMC